MGTTTVYGQGATPAAAGAIAIAGNGGGTITVTATGVVTLSIGIPAYTTVKFDCSDQGFTSLTILADPWGVPNFDASGNALTVLHLPTAGVEGSVMSFNRADFNGSLKTSALVSYVLGYAALHHGSTPTALDVSGGAPITTTCTGAGTQMPDISGAWDFAGLRSNGTKMLPSYTRAKAGGGTWKLYCMSGYTAGWYITENWDAGPEANGWRSQPYALDFPTSLDATTPGGHAGTTTGTVTLTAHADIRNIALCANAGFVVVVTWP